LKKKPNATKYSNCRTVSFIAHIANIVSRILRRKIEDIFGDDQFGFRTGKGARNAAGIILERILEIDEELCA
jgi:hypothetical protein